MVSQPQEYVRSRLHHHSNNYSTICLTRQTDYVWALNPWDTKIRAYHLNLSGYLDNRDCCLWSFEERRVQPFVSAKFNPGNLASKWMFLSSCSIMICSTAKWAVRSPKFHQWLIHQVIRESPSLQTSFRSISTSGSGSASPSRYKMERYPKMCEQETTKESRRVRKTCFMALGTGTSKEAKQARNHLQHVLDV